MTEDRIDIKQGSMPRFDSHVGVLDRLRDFGELREVVEGTRYYLISNQEVDAVCADLNVRPWMSIVQLQGNLLR